MRPQPDRPHRLTKAHRWGIATCFVALLAVLGAGCEVREDVTVSLNPDSSGQVSITVMMDEEALAAVGGEPVFNDVMAEMEARGWSVRPAQDSGFRGFAATAGFENQAELASLANDVSGQGTMPIDLSYTIVGDVATFEADVTTGDGSVGFVFTLIVDMPGEIQTSSAGSVEDNRVTWVISSDQSFSYYESLTVTSDAGGSISASLGGPWLILMVSVVLLLGLVAYSMQGTSSHQRNSPDRASAAGGYNPVKQFLGAREVTTSPRSVTTPGESIQTTGSPSAFCASCGTSLQLGDRFCPSCGASTTLTPGPDTGRA